MKNTTLRLMVFALVLLAVFASAFSPLIPVTGSNNSQPAQVQPAGNSATTASTVSVAGVFSYTVVQQPSGNAGYVSTEADRLTQFAMAQKYGSQGFLAHNYLAGASFPNVRVGDVVTITYQDGHSQSYSVQAVRSFQATSPNSASSNFIDLATNEKLTAKQLFFQTYGVKGNLVLQTCIAQGNESSWGRLFIIATPVEFE